MERNDFLEGMSHAACTVSVITTEGVHGRAGLTVSAMCSVSADPPSLLVCVHHQSKACEALRKNGVMCVNVLRDDQSHVSDTFAGRVKAPGGDRFSGAQWTSGTTGSPALANALVNFDCTIREHFQFGSHYIFIGEVKDIRYHQSGRALVYANRAYGRSVELGEFAVPIDGDTEHECLRLGCFVTLGPFFMPGLMADFLRDNSVTFQLFEGTQEKLTRGLENNEFDVALMYELDTSDILCTHLLAEVSPHVLLPAAHPLVQSTQISLHDLAGEPMVLLDILPSRDYFCSLFDEVGITPHIAFRSPSFEMVRGMVGNGLGYTLLVSKPANSMSYDGSALVTRPIKEDITPGRIVLAHRKDVPTSKLVDSFISRAGLFFSQWNQ